jgi:hypothetical protein
MKSNKALAVINGNELTTKDFMGSIDNELIHLHDTGDINRATNILSMLDNIDTVSGHAKAKMLWGFSEWWSQNKPDEEFSDHVESTTGTKTVTVKRYISVWKYIEDYTIPKEIAERPMRELVPIAKTIAQGYNIGKEEWRKIKLCSNDRELADVLRKIKGQAPRKSAKVIKLSRDGSLNLWVDNQKKFLGFLEIKSEDKDVQAAIEKIKLSAGIIEE